MCHSGFARSTSKQTRRHSCRDVAVSQPLDGNVMSLGSLGPVLCYRFRAICIGFLFNSDLLECRDFVEATSWEILTSLRPPPDGPEPLLPLFNFNCDGTTESHRRQSEMLWTVAMQIRSAIIHSLYQHLINIFLKKSLLISSASVRIHSKQNVPQVKFLVSCRTYHTIARLVSFVHLTMHVL